MVALKKLYVGAILILVVFATGCIGTSTHPSSSQETSSEQAPTTWTIFDENLKLDSQYYIGSPIQIKRTSTIKITLSILDNAKSISYIGIIPASTLETWKENKESATYTFVTHHVKDGTYTTALSPGEYYVVVGYADPIHKTLAQGTEVIKAGYYVGIPIDMSNIVYAANVQATIDIREDLDITLGFLNENEFNVYQEGGTANFIAKYEKTESGTYSITNAPPGYKTILHPGFYYLILDNGYSWFTDKTVDYTVTADVVYPARIHLTIKVEETG
ncbi:hypothetical protein X802_08360 [Thermococcus guaymasensis DSM 11113]|uniref:Uncharacterized protein n=1 Tax=Thermococcus guaymasensis DSM 11113 TaxID=1432656 RepID=A0A0X1KNB5_9EURY|nr:hypothetical protein [Thermococcus guaymasensis]AJC72782.1 hypothetical protein X802_08360 [Thermococcus guaymasensis DSM 11113]